VPTNVKPILLIPSHNQFHELTLNINKENKATRNPSLFFLKIIWRIHLLKVFEKKFNINAHTK
jgi:hypothetical protein